MLNNGEREIEVKNTEFWGSGDYYLEIYFDPQSNFQFLGNDLTVQAYINDKPVTAIETVKICNDEKAKAVYSIDGKRRMQLEKGLNIVKTSEGKAIKVMK